MRRQALKMSQETLAEKLGITFQQVQKYERGANRISAGRLFELARALKTTIPYFYEGAEAVTKALAKGMAEEGEEFTGLLDPEAVDLIIAFQSITDPIVRKNILALVKSTAASGKLKSR